MPPKTWTSNKEVDVTEIIRSAIDQTNSLSRHVAQIETPLRAKRSPASQTVRRVASHISGVIAEFIEFSKFGNTLTLKFRLVNTSTKRRGAIDPTGLDTYLLDETTGSRYKWTDRISNYASLEAGESVEYWTKFAFPEGASPNYLTIILDEGITVEHIEVP